MMAHRQSVLVAAVMTMTVAWCFGSIGMGEAFLSTSRSTAATSAATSSSTSTTATMIFSSPQQEEQPQQSSASSDSDADLLKDLPFVPPEVMAKFMAAVGDPLTAGSIQAGYQSGIISSDELEEIRTKIPTMQEAASATSIPQAQSKQTIEEHWKAALAGQPWHVQTMGKLATATIVPLVAKLQEKSVRQANAMKWINENALPMIQGNATVVGLLSLSDRDRDSDSNGDSNGDMSKLSSLTFNNTRAKYETDRGVWSASMDVFVAGGNEGGDATGESSPEIEITKPSEADAALAALQKGIGDDDGKYDDDLSSFAGSIAVLDSSTSRGVVEGISKQQSPSRSSNNKNNKNKVGLVNAYFVPNDEIKILVVEIDGILHNVTWKGLD